MKLTKEQERVMNEAKADIDWARNHSFLEWVGKSYFPWESKQHGFTDTDCGKMLIELADRLEKPLTWFESKYEDEKNGKAYTHRCNSRTLYKLAEYGLIKIETDGKDINSPIDIIWVLNY